MRSKTPATEEAAMLKPFLILCAVVLLVITPTPTPTLAAGTPPQDTAKTTPASRERAKKLYAQDCSMCHGDNGNGKTDMATSMNVVLSDWTDPKSLTGKSDQELFDNIRKGNGDKMPPEDSSRAKDEEVWALIAHIRNFSKGMPSTPAPAPADAAPAAAAPAAPAVPPR
jgi:mono/diheme cytochrome c family protein